MSFAPTCAWPKPGDTDRPGYARSGIDPQPVAGTFKRGDALHTRARRAANVRHRKPQVVGDPFRAHLAAAVTASTLRDVPQR
jgi:hypothetical protein